MQPWQQWEETILGYAQLKGWLRAHFRAAQTAKGWRTPVSADGKGFPDILMVRGKRIVAIEAKTGKGKLSEEQADWLDALEVAGVEAYVLRPSQQKDMEKILS